VLDPGANRPRSSLVRWGDLVRRTARAVSEDDCLGGAGELAYFWFLALFPGLLFVGALAAYLPVQHLLGPAMQALASVAPGGVLVMVREQLRQITHERHLGLLMMSFLGALWSSSSGMTAMIAMVNQAHHAKDERSWWRVRVLAIALTCAAASLAVVAVVLTLAGSRLAPQVAKIPGGSTLVWSWRIARWPLIFGLFVTALEWIYYFGSDVPRRRASITPGSIAAATLALLLSCGLKWYAFYVGHYQATYGTIGGVIVVLLWLYGSGLAILIGAELNAAVENTPAVRSVETSAPSG